MPLYAAFFLNHYSYEFMDTSSILKSWKQQQFRPVYWLEGEESYFIDALIEEAEKNILSTEEAAFNLIVLYGKETAWSDVVNACMRYPVFAQKQVVILKEAQQMKDIDKLESYLQQPSPSTILLVAYKEKRIDGRSKMAKLLKEKAELLVSNKVKEHELPGWIQQYLKQKGYEPTQKAVLLVADHIGNDLSRVVNELEKLFIHLKERKKITEEDIEHCIGISKEFNLFEFQSAIGKKNVAQSFRILQYFEQNPKAAPMQMMLPLLYSYFAKVYMLLTAKGDDKAIAAQTGINGWFIKDYRQTANLYGYQGIESALLLLHEYNLKSIGIHSTGNAEGKLLKEFLGKLLYH